MSIVKIPETMLVYKALELNSTGITVESLAEKSQVPAGQLTAILKTFAEPDLMPRRAGLCNQMVGPRTIGGQVSAALAR